MPTDSYPLHPGQTYAEPYYCTIPLEEYENLKDEISHLRSLNECMRAELEKRGVIVIPPSAELDKYEKEWVEAERKAVGQMIPYYPDKFCPRCGKPLDEKKWRKVGEELPEEYKEILFIDADGIYSLGSMFTIPHYDGTPIEQYWSGRGEPRSTNVTHWMPLPEPPKEGA